MEQERKGLRPHPYILRDLEVVANKRDQHIGMLDVQQIIYHFNVIFGVNDESKGLFSIGMTTQQKREAVAIGTVGGVLGAAIKAAKEGTVSQDAQEQVRNAMNKVGDAAAHGLAKYTRLADEAEANIQ